MRLGLSPRRHARPRHRRRRWRLKLTASLALVSLLVSIDPVEAFWSSTSAANGTGASRATTVNAGSTPTVSVSGSTVTVSWAATTLATGAAVTGYDITRYDSATSSATDPQNGCSGTVSTTSCTETGVPDGTWKYTVTPQVGGDWTGAESALSAAVLSDGTPPSSSLKLTSVSGNASLSGTTLYYNSSSAGSFTITNTVTDSGSGAASSATSALGGTSTGWTHNPSTVTTPISGPYVSNTFSWTAGSTSNPTETITTTDTAGNSIQTGLTFTEDSSAPSGTISYADGFSSGRSVAISYTTAANGSPVATAQVQRARASLKNGVCGNYGTYANIGPANPGSPYSDANMVAGACYQYKLIITDQAGNVGTAQGTATAMFGYAGAVLATSGLSSYWRLGENGTATNDTFTGTANVALQDRTGEAGATWTRHAASSADAVLTAGGRVRKEGTTAGALYYSSGVPASADYRVSADIYAASLLASDRAAVVGRLDPTATTYYSASYDVATGAYTLASMVSGTLNSLGTSTATFAVGTSHRVSLDMSGSTIRVLVDGTAVISVSNTDITAVGRGGLLLGSTTKTTDTDAVGLQVDNIVVGPGGTVPGAADSRGNNAGSYVSGPALGQTGVLAGDIDSAVGLDGVDDVMQVASPSGLPTGASARTVEVWFKTSGTGREVLFNYGSPSTNAEFGLWLNAGGKGFTSWAGGSGTNITWSLTNAVNDGAWHEAALTYSSSALSLYVDGALVSSKSATRSTTLDSTGFVLGAVLASNQSGATGGYFAGTLDEAAIYSSALSATLIADHYALANPYQDVDGPTGGSIDGTNLIGTDTRYRNSTSLTLGLAKGTDPSGLASSGAQLLRASGTITSGVCNAVGTYAVVATDPTTPYTTSVTNGYCYRYRYAVADALGNITTYASPVIKVDTSAPAAASISSTSAVNTYRTGYTVYYRSVAPNGSITITASSSDTGSGIAGFVYPALGTGWTSTAGASSAVNTYAWSAAGPAAPGGKAVQAVNNAALTASRTLTWVDDSTAPSGGDISYADGKTTATTATVTLTLGTDSGSGISTKYVQQATAPVNGGACGTFGAWTTVSTSSTTSYTSGTLANDTCYRYQYLVTDRVGNATAYGSASVIRREPVYSTMVTGTSGSLDFWRLGEASGASTAIDAKGGENNATYVGSPTLGVTGAVVGDTDTGATFDGATQSVTANRNLTGTTMTLEMWVNTTSTAGGSSASWSGNAALVDADVSGNAADFGVSMNTAGAITAGTGSSSGDTTVTSQSGLNDGQWHQVVLTRSGATLVLYVDGAQVATTTSGSTATLTASASLTLAGAASGGRWFSGSLDEVATYNAALAASVVASHYNAAK